MYYVYYLISLSSNESYVGSTNDLKRRVKEHNDGKTFSTKRYRPWQLQYYEAFIQEPLARMREHNLKHNGNALRELKKRLTLPSSNKSNKQGGAGFTLIEVLIAMGITLAVLTYALTNYYRSSNDSALKREASLLMARLRFAQQETASGKTFNYCYHFTGQTCTGNGNTVKVCDNDPTKRCSSAADCGGALCDTECDGKQCCPNGVGGSGPCPAGHETPDGGFAVSFSCQASLPPDGLHTYPMFELAKSRYALFAERRACVYTDNCFPPRYTSFNDSLISSDGIISSMFYVGSNYNRLKGDTVQEQYTVNTDVEIADIQITALNAIVPTSGPPKQTFHCGDDSPWEGVRVHTVDPSSSIVPNNYPIQAAIRFAPPDGQEVFITDNVSVTPPPYSANPTNAWVKAEVMLKLKKRSSDCRVISITRAGVIADRNDANCNITDSN